MSEQRKRRQFLADMLFASGALALTALADPKDPKAPKNPKPQSTPLPPSTPPPDQFNRTGGAVAPPTATPTPSPSPKKSGS